jgi:hypothetical protein
MDEKVNEFLESPKFKTIAAFNNEKFSQESPMKSDISKDWSLSLKIQKNQFNQMIEKAMDLDSYDYNTKFDVRKYLPKDDIYSTSKIMRKYKNLLNNSNENKNNNNNYNNKYYSNNNYDNNCNNNYDNNNNNNNNNNYKNNNSNYNNLLKISPQLYQTQNQNFQIEKQQNIQKNNMSISEIPIPTDSLFDMDSKIDEINLNFIDKKNSNNEENNIINNNNNLIIENNEEIQNDFNINIDLNNENEYFFNVFIENKKENQNEINENNEINEIDKLNIFLNKNNQEDYSWNCLDFNEENNLIDSFFNKKI